MAVNRLQLDSDTQRLLLRHFQERLDNRPWVDSSLKGDVEAFPYRANPEETGRLGNRSYTPSQPLTSFPDACNSDKPRYTVNIPMRHLPGDAATEPFSQLLRLFRQESFGKNESESKEEVKQRLFVVIGINQIHSLDPSINRAFQEFIKKLPPVQEVVYRVFGFSWAPQWKQREGLSGRIYSAEKSFLLLKAFSSPESDVATPVRRRFEGGETGLNPDISAQVPFQRIRSAIQHSSSTRDAVEHFEKKAPESAGYFVVMDADLIALKQGRMGLFTRMDRCIEGIFPSVVSLGYSLAEDQPPLLRAGVKMDMKVREALGCLAYPPEPCSAFLVRRPGQPHHLTRLTFTGNGNTLENRRFYQSGRASGVLQRDAVFVADGGVTMGTPKRMLTKKNRSVVRLTPAQVKMRKNLEAMKGTRQTHASALKWAENVYAGLAFTCPSAAEARGYLSHLFAVYDPIGRMFATPGRFSPKVFDEVMAHYHDPLSEGLRNTLNTALGHLAKLGMSKEQLEEVKGAAQRSGEAIYRHLHDLLK